MSSSVFRSFARRDAAWAYANSGLQPTRTNPKIYPGWDRPGRINTRRALALVLLFIGLMALLLSALPTGQTLVAPAVGSTPSPGPKAVQSDPFGIYKYREQFYQDWAKSQLFQSVFNNAALEQVRNEVAAISDPQQQLDRLGLESCAILLVSRGQDSSQLYYDSPLGARYRAIMSLFDQIRQSRLPQSPTHDLPDAEDKYCKWLYAHG